jgi:hypothetical protein
MCPLRLALGLGASQCRVKQSSKLSRPNKYARTLRPARRPLGQPAGRAGRQRARVARRAHGQPAPRGSGALCRSARWRGCRAGLVTGGCHHASLGARAVHKCCKPQRKVPCLESLGRRRPARPGALALPGRHPVASRPQAVRAAALPVWAAVLVRCAATRYVADRTAIQARGPSRQGCRPHCWGLPAIG